MDKNMTPNRIQTKSRILTDRKETDEQQSPIVLRKNYSLSKNFEQSRTTKLKPHNDQQRFRIHLSSLIKQPIKITPKLYEQSLLMPRKKIITVPNVPQTLQQHHYKQKQISEEQKTNGKLNLLPFQINLKKNIQLTPINMKKWKLSAFGATKAGFNGKTNKINQDSYQIQLSLPKDISFFLVCDGHGANGHYASQFVKEILIKNLQYYLKNRVITHQCIIDIFKQAYIKTNQSLLSSDINTELSGTTAVGVFVHKNKVTCLNVGDSRAIIIGQQKAVWTVKELSHDHKPERKDERQRILLAGGQIRKQKDNKGNYISPQRVWKKDLQLPGLAMTRSFGDKAGMKAGTIGQPEIETVDLIQGHKLIVIASDGIWQYMSNEEVMQLLIPFYKNKKLQQGIEQIIEKATAKWKQKSITRDDITIIVVELQYEN